MLYKVLFYYNINRPFLSIPTRKVGVLLPVIKNITRTKQYGEAVSTSPYCFFRSEGLYKKLLLCNSLMCKQNLLRFSWLNAVYPKICHEQNFAPYSVAFPIIYTNEANFSRYILSNRYINSLHSSIVLILYTKKTGLDTFIPKPCFMVDDQDPVLDKVSPCTPTTF